MTHNHSNENPISIKISQTDSGETEILVCLSSLSKTDFRNHPNEYYASLLVTRYHCNENVISIKISHTDSDSGETKTLVCLSSLAK